MINIDLKGKSLKKIVSGSARSFCMFLLPEAPPPPPPKKKKIKLFSDKAHANSVKQFGSISSQTFCQSCGSLFCGSKLFAKVM